MSFSQDSEICKRCKYYKCCDNKRMAACAVFDIPNTAQPGTAMMAESIRMPLSQDVILNGEQLKKAVEQQLKVMNWDSLYDVMKEMLI